MDEIKEADKIIDEIGSVTYEKVEIMRTKLEKCTSSITDVSVQGSHRIHSREDALLLLAEMSQILDESQKKLREIYNKTEDRNLRIYFDKKYFNLTNAQLEYKYGITKRQVQRICKKIEKNKQMSP